MSHDKALYKSTDTLLYSQKYTLHTLLGDIISSRENFFIHQTPARPRGLLRSMVFTVCRSPIEQLLVSSQPQWVPGISFWEGTNLTQLIYLPSWEIVEPAVLSL